MNGDNIPDDEKPNTNELNIRVKDQVSHINQITFSLLIQNGTVVCFKMKKTIKLKKLMSSYCNRHGYPQNSVRFIYEGEEIRETDTPESLKMNDNDQIETMVQQRGGAPF